MVYDENQDNFSFETLLFMIYVLCCINCFVDFAVGSFKSQTVVLFRQQLNDELICSSYMLTLYQYLCTYRSLPTVILSANVTERNCTTCFSEDVYTRQYVTSQLRRIIVSLFTSMYMYKYYTYICLSFYMYIHTWVYFVLQFFTLWSGRIHTNHLV